ncbi:MAG: metallophosphoesterase family protein [Akkermansiaceae bacterium]
MKYGILSDIHANLEALTSVIADAKSRGVNRFICLGDVVGYNANPSECVDLIRDLNCQVIMGNHDQYTVAKEIPKAVNGRARLSLEWTRENIRPDQVEWLANLPMTRRVGGFEIVHASLNEPGDWNYILNAIDAILHFHHQKTPLCFFGHTHSPMYFTTEVRKTFRGESHIDLQDDRGYLINVGSVGQPRGEDKRAQYAVYDSRAKTVDIMRVEYDVALTCQKIRKAGLPEHNALRLEKTDAEATAAVKLIEETNNLINSIK